MVQTNERILGGGAKIERQIILPWGKALEISIKSLMIRFWRSLITMSGVILAIAFLMSVWTSSTILGELKQAAQGETVEAMQVKELLTKNKVELTGGKGGIEAKNIWLICLSLLVCVVGIVNAMLMSVTERIHEIGTMKCLGALDGFIIRLFFLESSFQGIIGTAAGIVLGLIASILSELISYRGYVFEYFPAGGVVLAATYTLVIGTLLSVFAAIFPAYRAAKMQPVEAMRVEE